MFKLSSLFKKTILLALVAAFALAALPMRNAYASDLSEPPSPPADQTQVTDERIEQIWARLQQAYERQGNMLEHRVQVVERIQGLIDRMNERGKDTTALQAALDAYEGALQEAQSAHESAQGIISSHQGFDANGQVTDREQAKETIKQLRDALKEVHQILGEPSKALREAIKAFKDANRPADTSS